MGYMVDGMQESKEAEEDIQMRRPLAVRALRRSNVRSKIAEYLFDISPSGRYTSDIAYQVKTTPTNVIGAIRGLDERYRDNESLLNLQIVEELKNSENTKMYKLTDFGRELIQSLKEQR